ncbi:hypothetical protein CEXT_335181 [Caerostris extrusa]|uniref:Uncharacterized protein n=1 Tax=Caerostris extrusa TaxID=172846 RepID=A0AAV4NMU4_CAEEX|nr:hypothetical protein CEXT_335181 [Caerostris extrusa]
MDDPPLSPPLRLPRMHSVFHERRCDNPTGRQEDDRHRKNRLFKLRDTCLHRSPKSAGRFRALRRVGALACTATALPWQGMHTLLGSMGSIEKYMYSILEREANELFD